CRRSSGPDGAMSRADGSRSGEGPGASGDGIRLTRCCRLNPMRAAPPASRCRRRNTVRQPLLDWLVAREDWRPRGIVLLVRVQREPDCGRVGTGDSSEDSGHAARLLADLAARTALEIHVTILLVASRARIAQRFA